MVTGLNRRNILKGAIAAGASLALPMRTFAQASPLTPRDRAVLDVAKREIERAGNAIWRKDIAAIADYGVHSALPRFHFANIEAGTVRSFLVAHGTGSDPEHDGWLNEFSNTPGSNATSRGSYVTYEWYKGKYGTSIRLGGLDPENSNALPRAIVAHSADYARASHISQYGKLGRSNGCFAMSPEDFNEALWHISGGRLIYSDRLGLG